jgi:hypothetical protein
MTIPRLYDLTRSYSRRRAQELEVLGKVFNLAMNKPKALEKIGKAARPHEGRRRLTGQKWWGRQNSSDG